MNKNIQSTPITSESYLNKVTIGQRKPHNAPIKIVEYDTNWGNLYNLKAERIKHVLGDTVLQMEHVGSISVPQLCAKPIIDLLLVVIDAANESMYVPHLESAGYSLRIREPEWYEHRLLKGPDTEINLHVFSKGTPEIQRMFQFRDWLRNNPKDRDEYAQIKQTLAQRVWEHVQDYADAKTAIINEILKRVKANTFNHSKTLEIDHYD